MITQAHAKALTEQGIEFITALKAVQVRALVNSGELQLSLFDEKNLAEITSELYPSERLVVCRNPAVAAERARKRESLLTATETRAREGQRDGLRATRNAAELPPRARSASAPERSSTSTRWPSTSN